MPLIKHLLNASELEAPDPYKQASAILQQMKNKEYLHMRHRRIPYPLFELCDGLSMQYELREGEDTLYDIIIFHKKDLHLLQKEGVL